MWWEEVVLYSDSSISNVMIAPCTQANRRTDMGSVGYECNKLFVGSVLIWSHFSFGGAMCVCVCIFDFITMKFFNLLVWFSLAFHSRLDIIESQLFTVQKWNEKVHTHIRIPCHSVFCLGCCWFWLKSHYKFSIKSAFRSSWMVPAQNMCIFIENERKKCLKTPHEAVIESSFSSKSNLHI